MPFLKKLIEPPSSLHLPTVGLDISDNSFKYIKLHSVNGDFRVEDFGAEKLPSGILSSGTIQNKKSLAQTLATHFSKKSYKHVALALPEEHGFVRTIHLPKITPEELGEAISLQIEEHIPLSPEETSFTFRVLPQQHSRDTMDVLLVAFPTPILTAYKEVISEAGLTPVALEIESQAIARAVIPQSEWDKAVLVIDIGLTRTSFLFAKDGFVQHTSTVPIGGQNMHAAIAKALTIDEKEAERVKKEYGSMQPQERKAVFDALMPLIQNLKEEASRRIDFWNVEMGPHKNLGKEKTGVTHVYLCGGDANLTDLPRHLSAELNMPVNLANVWVNVFHDSSYVPEIEFRESLEYATAIGLALGANTNVWA